MRTSLTVFCLLCSTFGFHTVAQAQRYRDPEAPIEERVQSALDAMTLDEKIEYIGGKPIFFVNAVPRLGIPELRMSNGLTGVVNWGPSTIYPAGILSAATWDTALVNRLGHALGRDARARGVHVLLGPGVNIYRAPVNGRNFEYFGEDPFLATRMAVNCILGVQSEQVMAVVKHFAVANQEWDRDGISADVDERTLHEIYLSAFKGAVEEAHVGAVMNSYNLVNGVHASQNRYLLTDVLKSRWKFDGFVMSDWNSTYDGVAAATAGLDLEMPMGRSMSRETLLPAIRNGEIPMSVVDDKVRRILRELFRFGFYDRPQLDTTIPKDDSSSAAVSLALARGGIVLLKNQDALLPLKRRKIESVAVIGPNADGFTTGAGSASGTAFHTTTILQGIRDLAGHDVQVTYVPGIPAFDDYVNNAVFYTAPGASTRGLIAAYFANQDLRGRPSVTRIEKTVSHVWPAEPDVSGIPADHFSIRYTGVVRPPATGRYRFVLRGDDGFRLIVGDDTVADEWHDQRTLQVVKGITLEGGKEYPVILEYYDNAKAAEIALGWGPATPQFGQVAAAAASADVAIVAVGFNSSLDPEREGEYHDRPFELPADQDSLILAVAHANPNTIVTLNAGGNVDMQPWLSQVKGVIHAWYGGQDAGRAVAEVLFGVVNPSGKLPASFEKVWKDNPVYPNYYDTDGTGHLSYREGVFYGYRYYDAHPADIQFPFGYGLSYTTFRYRKLAVTNVSTPHAPKLLVSFDITNTGPAEGAEVAQVYVHQRMTSTSRPEKELKGFTKIVLRPGETRQVKMILRSDAFSYYKEPLKGFGYDPGTFDVLVGASSRDIRLTAAVIVR